jgi:hypothetical protein
MRAWFIAPVACHALGSAGGGGGSAAGGGGGLSEGGGAGASPEDDEQPARSKIKTKIMRAPSKREAIAVLAENARSSGC